MNSPQRIQAMNPPPVAAPVNSEISRAVIVIAYPNPRCFQIY